MKNNHPFRIVIALAVLIITASMNHAAIAPLSAEELKASASHIVTGIVKKVVSNIVPNSNGGGATDRVFKITLSVSFVEKGKLKPGEKEIVLLAWTPHKRPRPFPGPQGHSNIPRKGKMVRVFLKETKDPGEYRVILPNGFQDVQSKGSKPTAEKPKE